MKLLLEALDSSGVRLGRSNIPAWISVTVVAAVLLITAFAGLVVSAGRSGSRSRASGCPARRTGSNAGSPIVDTDGNGVWQREDGEALTRRLCETFGHPPDSALGRPWPPGRGAVRRPWLPHMDANGDQEISRDEFAAASAVPSRTGQLSTPRSAPRRLR